MTSPAVRLSTEDARSIARRFYGEDAGVAELPCYYGQNFHLVPDAGPSFVLKVARPGELVSNVDLQHRAAEYLAESAFEVEVPRARPNRDGATATIVHGRIIHVLSYIEGEPWSPSAAARPGQLQRLGRLVASLGPAFAGFSHPALHRISDWDMRRVPDLRPHLSTIGNAKRRAIATRIIDRFESTVAPRLGDARHGVIHGDVNNDNLLVDDGGRIVGLIDFEDVSAAPLVCETGIAVAYAMLGQDDPHTAAVHVIEGRHAAIPLLPSEAEIVFDLGLARAVMSVTFSARFGETDPDNEHAKVNEDAAWTVLEHFDGTQLGSLIPELRHAG